MTASVRRLPQVMTYQISDLEADFQPIFKYIVYIKKLW